MAASEDPAQHSPADRRGPTPMRIAFALREVEAGVPFAEAVVEVSADAHAVLLDQAYESGFILAAGGPPPPTSAEVLVEANHFAGLALVGERQIWEMHPPAPVATAWTDAAAHHGAAIVSIAAPGTWPTDAEVAGLTPDELGAMFSRRLDEARAAGRILHGAARVLHS